LGEGLAAGNLDDQPAQARLPILQGRSDARDEGTVGGGQASAQGVDK
jgi:hypothetical protein